MQKSTKWIIGIGSFLLIGTGVGLFLYNKHKNKESSSGEKGEAKGDTEKAPDNGSNPTDSVINHTNPPSGASYPSTPFKNSDEGNKFRQWVNSHYPAYAKANQLDPSGAYNNSYIRKAYLQYGAEYSKVIVPSSVKAELPASDFKSGDLVYVNHNIQSVALYSFPEINGAYVKGTVRKNDALDRPIGKFIRVAIQGKTPSTTWVKVTIPTYRDVNNVITNKSGDFYMLASNVSKSSF